MPEKKSTHNGIILLVDDEWLVRWSLERALTRFGFEVLTASSGREALEVIGRRLIDWLITDLKMPDLDGFEILRRTRQLRPSARLALITAFGSPAVEKKAIQMGALYVTKPFNVDAFVSTIVESFKLAPPT